MDDKLQNSSEIVEQPKLKDEKDRFFAKGHKKIGGIKKGDKHKYTMAKLIEAIEAEEAIAKKEDVPGLFQMFARMAYRNPNVMIAIMKKFIPDKLKQEFEGLEGLLFKVKVLNGNKKSGNKGLGSK